MTIPHGTQLGARPCRKENGGHCAACAAKIPHGTNSGYTAWGCRCQLCGDANRAYTAERHRIREPEHGTAARAGRCRRENGEHCPDCHAKIPHGTRAAYSVWGCRCEECRAALRAARRSSTKHGTQTGAQACVIENGEHCAVCLAKIPHGTMSGYTAWRCRCEPCRSAWAVYDRAWRLDWVPEHGTAKGAAACRRENGEHCPTCAANIPHGTTTGYRDWLCACALCSVPGANYNRRFKTTRRVHTFGGTDPDWPVDPEEILARDGMVCMIADELGAEPHEITSAEWNLDHIIPLSVGGYHVPWNVQVGCPHHNKSKNNRGDRDRQERKVRYWQRFYSVSVPLYRPEFADPYPMPAPVPF